METIADAVHFPATFDRRECCCANDRVQTRRITTTGADRYFFYLHILICGHQALHKIINFQVRLSYLILETIVKQVERNSQYPSEELATRDYNSEVYLIEQGWARGF